MTGDSFIMNCEDSDVSGVLLLLTRKYIFFVKETIKEDCHTDYILPYISEKDNNY